jgi:hypothetical protein
MCTSWPVPSASETAPARGTNLIRKDGRCGVPRRTFQQWYARMGLFRSRVQGGIPGVPRRAAPDRAPRCIHLGLNNARAEGEDPGPANAHIDARNAVALALVHHMAVDDQHALMAKHANLYHDDVHFNEDGSNIADDAAAATIRHPTRSSARNSSSCG